MIAFDKSMLEVGDSLLYYGQAAPNNFKNSKSDLVSLAIAVKTGYWLSHIEIYAGEDMSFASRNWIGVDKYPLRMDGLVAVRRPRQGLDLIGSERWFKSTARGQGYDFKGLLCFYLAANHGSQNKMFCSEFALRFYRMGFFEPFNPEMDADRTAPCEFWKTGMMSTVWQKHQP
jgi:hypothetical protein